MYHLPAKRLRAVIGVIAFLFPVICLAQAPETESQKLTPNSGHLFILSGQSNMTGNVKKGFTTTVHKALNEEDVTIIHHCKPGRGIRFWVKDYQLPKEHPMAGLSNNKSNGEEFPKLVNLVKKSCDATTFKAVHFIWMQGESDANRDLSDAYERSFKLLTERLKKELGIEQMNIVIGRISDYGLHGDKAEGWKRMRSVQQKLAENDPLGCWINTDDLNGGDESNPKGDLHYPKDESVKLGERLAEAALLQWVGAPIAP